MVEKEGQDLHCLYRQHQDGSSRGWVLWSGTVCCGGLQESHGPIACWPRAEEGRGPGTAWIRTAPAVTRPPSTPGLDRRCIDSGIAPQTDPVARDAICRGGPRRESPSGVRRASPAAKPCVVTFGFSGVPARARIDGREGKSDSLGRTKGNVVGCSSPASLERALVASKIVPCPGRYDG